MVAGVTFDSVVDAVKQEWPELLSGCTFWDTIGQARYIARRIGYDFRHDTTADDLVKAITKASIGEFKLRDVEAKATQVTTTIDPEGDKPLSTDAGSW